MVLRSGAVTVFVSFLLCGIATCGETGGRYEHDLGTVVLFRKEDLAKTLISRFEYTNRSAAEVTVKAVRTGCRCLAVRGIEKGRRIKPGEKVSIQNSISLAGMRFTNDLHLEQIAYVEISGRDGGELLSFVTRAFIKLAGLPTDVNLGYLRGDARTLSHSWLITRPAEASFTPKSCKSNDPRVRASVRKVPFSGEYRVECSFKTADFPNGRNGFSIELDYSFGENREGRQESRVSFQKVPRIAHPAAVSLGVCHTDQATVSRSFLVGPGYAGASLELVAASIVPQQGWKCSTRRLEGDAYEISVAFLMAEAEVSHHAVEKAVLLLECEEQEDPIEIPCFVMCLRNPQVRAGAT